MTYREHIKERAEQLRRVSRGVKKFNLSDNHTPDPNAIDIWEDRARGKRTRLPTRGSYVKKEGYSFGNKIESRVEVPPEFLARMKRWRQEERLTMTEAANVLTVPGATALYHIEKCKSRRMAKSDYDRIAAIIKFVGAEQ